MSEPGPVLRRPRRGGRRRRVSRASGLRAGGLRAPLTTAPVGSAGSPSPSPALSPASGPSPSVSPPPSAASPEPAVEGPGRPVSRPPRRARRGRGRRRGLRERFLSENLRFLISLLVSFPAGMSVALALPQLGEDGPGNQGERIAALLLLLIIVISLYTLLFAVLTHIALSGQPRARLVGTARLPRVRKHVRLYRVFAGRSGAAGEVAQLLFTAAIAILLLVMRPDGVPMAALLALTVGAVATAWIGAVMTFAVEYAAEDAHGDAFELAGTPGHERTLADYVYGAVLIQAANGTDLAPTTPRARRLVRDHVILAHVSSTIIITLGVSALLTAIG